MNTQITAILAGCLLSFTSIAQDDGPLEHGRIALAGYGDVTYLDAEMQGTSDMSTYAARFVPIFLYQLNDRLHVEAEVEFRFSESGETETEVEYADLHYFLTDTVTLTAGKFLVPFANFGPNLHPSWINRMPTMPGIYGGHGGNGLMSGVLPILKDIGISVQHNFKFGDNQKIMMDFYVVNGVGAEAAGGDHDAEEASEPEAGEEAHTGTAPEINFESGNSDNNEDKAFGGRIAYGFLPQFEVGYSFYKAAYDDAEKLDFDASAVDLSWLGTYFKVRAEYIKTEAEGLVEIAGHDEHDDPTIDVRSFDRNGWYVEGSWQMRQFGNQILNPIELVASYARIDKSNEGERWSYGINYWLSSSTVVKLAYDDTELKDGRDQSRVFAQISFGL